MLTISTVPMIALMSSQRPVPSTLSFIVGTYVTYFACSVLVFVVIVLLLLGMVPLADGIGWIVGRSFIPIE